MEQVNLLNKQDSYPNELSGGQQQRVAIARALMMHPSVMLFDEPTSALDPNAVKGIMNIIHELADKGMTVIIATHGMRLAQQLSTRTIFLYKGEIIETGETLQMFQQPKTKQFKNFIGENNEI